MVVMLLSLLEGNVVNGTIARQMVDMLVESSSNVTMILKFFDMFLKLRDIMASDAFRDYVTDPRGLISKKDFQKVRAWEGFLLPRAAWGWVGRSWMPVPTRMTL
ncbi:ryanodine receptor 1-like [Numida meleagris]|uniref:ryanodine receptor 1-like n=1 Tax=Numida meleagris TaxID=8996 RepID=UPI000B3E04B3|nr:ryanodine receptor 1-like [Numida meleagris]